MLNNCGGLLLINESSGLRNEVFRICLKLTKSCSIYPLKNFYWIRYSGTEKLYYFKLKEHP